MQITLQGELKGLSLRLKPLVVSLRHAEEGLAAMCVAPARTGDRSATDNFAFAEVLLKEQRTRVAARMDERRQHRRYDTR